MHTTTKKRIARSIFYRNFEGCKLGETMAFAVCDSSYFLKQADCHYDFEISWKMCGPPFDDK